MALTRAQQDAVSARGNVLVVAGAGTGKTRALVERCVDCLINGNPRASLDEILVVTFTEAAAAEIRQRVRSRLQEEALRTPSEAHWQEQLALFETTHVGTLHSFCLKLVRQHFYELELDPQLTVLPEDEAKLLADETLERLLQKHYEGMTREAEAVQHLIQTYGRGSDQSVRHLVMRLHHYTQTLPDPAAWFESQLRIFTDPQPQRWKTWFLQAVSDWLDRASIAFQKHAAASTFAARCLAAISEIRRPIDASGASRLLQFLKAIDVQPERQNSGGSKILQELSEDAQFLCSLDQNDADADALQEDWKWARTSMMALVRLAGQFTAAYAQQKRELGSVDFHDLEQHTLRLLWTPDGQPTNIANEWRNKLRFLFVDEYQDINTAQDRILVGLSREEAQANRFLVGDVKQSIYRFRLANPRIFQGYAAAWRSGNSRTIPLVENFRSRQEILHFINSVFEATMHSDIGGVEYNDEARLMFGGSLESVQVAGSADTRDCIELHFRIKGGSEALEIESESSESTQELLALEEAAKEARVIGLRLKQLRAEKVSVWDEKLHRFRPVDWGDMAILLRAPSGKTESFAKEFARLEIPLQVTRGGFYNSSEISDLLSLLRLLDNPLQDIPAIAVLRSPLVGLSIDELASIRLANLKAPVWTAVNQWRELHSEPATAPPQAQAPAEKEPELLRKISGFLERFGRWRRLARQVSLCACLETILTETHYATWAQLQPRGAQRQANIQRLLGLAQHFDQLQRQGLYRFIRYVEAQQNAEAEPDVAATSAENAVRLVSIHQSKGLEFPVVVVADLAKPFNLSDLRSDIILDEQFGLCPQVIPPGLNKRYPSIAHWLASRRQKSELLGEELRLLYVAMTRARDLLILVCSLSEKRYAAVWAGAHEAIAPQFATNSSDWLAWAVRDSAPEGLKCGEAKSAPLKSGAGNCGVRWALHGTQQLLASDTEPGCPGAKASAQEDEIPVDVRETLCQRLGWEYEFQPATREPAKTTVSILRRRADEQSVSSALLVPTTQEMTEKPARMPRGLLGNLSKAAETGIAHHLFLQHVCLENTDSINDLSREAERLVESRLLTPEQAQVLDLPGIAAFWQSDIGQCLQRERQSLHRELPFTFRLSPTELAEFSPQQDQTRGRAYNDMEKADDEFVVVQGVADIAVILPKEIWVLDFKTDRVTSGTDLPSGKYASQLKLYARALGLIYKRPVTRCWLWFLMARRALLVEV